MSAFLKISAVVALVLLGPAMYVMSRAHTLARAFSRVQIGAPAAAVVASMGKPQDEAGKHVVPNSATAHNSTTEWRYSAWPFPQIWVVELRAGRVIGKEQLER